MKSKLFVTTLIAAFLFVLGCQETEDAIGESPSEETHQENEDKQEAKGNRDTASHNGFPVTIESADQSVEISEKPEHILPLSLDVTEIVLELVDPSNVVAISESVGDPQLSTHTEKAEEISDRVSSAVNIDPEEILSFNTDLLLLTKMHGQEEEANKVLNEVDLPIITFNTMGTVDAIIENIETIGKAVGETEKATELMKTMAADIEAIQNKIPTDMETPSILVLSEVGPGTGPFMMGPGNISYDLIQLAGATPAVDKIDLKSSTPASIEQVLKMEPDYIFLLDFVGEGEEAFTELSENPGWDSLTAIENGNVKVLDAKYLMNPNTKVVEGLDTMVNWIYDLEG